MDFLGAIDPETPVIWYEIDALRCFLCSRMRQKWHWPDAILDNMESLCWLCLVLEMVNNRDSRTELGAFFQRMIDLIANGNEGYCVFSFIHKIYPPTLPCFSWVFSFFFVTLVLYVCLKSPKFPDHLWNRILQNPHGTYVEKLLWQIGNFSN